jgi:hypothetical protein
MAAVDLHPDFREFFESLNSNGVRYLVIGGYAVIHHGYHRMTSDVDIWIDANVENAMRVSMVLQDWGGFAPEDVPPTLFNEVGKMVSFGREPVAIDILTRPAGVEFDACFDRRVMANWDGIDVPLISLADLKVNKIASGRDKDRADLAYLPPEA